ncbi:MAG: tyrosine-type recombinase/integrase [Nanoarchaeota archaeon]|nr:tyrosine-type recombinase/integrase [Nanoarchaeota archaeon]MBU1027826.1 tyrosine-type recombinase/integrase [Nanoarchaeota archaeon]
MKIDPYKNKETYFAWKEKVKNGIDGLGIENSNIILSYLQDMEMGLNIARGSKKGPRSYIRLNTLKNRMVLLAKRFYEYFKVDPLVNIQEEQLHILFNNMRNGTIKKQNGKQYISPGDLVRDFKSFWHWHMRIERKKGNIIQDICYSVDDSKDKPKWVYLTEEQIRKLCNDAKYEYRILIMFLYDTGIRSPTELINVKVSDIYNDFKELNIRDEISKTFGRRIKLMLCSDLVKEYVKIKELSSGDQLFPISPPVFNKYLKRLAKKVLGDSESLAGKKYCDISMYDFRHCACCYWLPRYKSESALKYRFGWRKSDKIHYYSEMLGMKDTISEEDLLMDVTKTEIEQRLMKSERDKEIMQERMKHMEEQMKKVINMFGEVSQKNLNNQIVRNC